MEEPTPPGAYAELRVPVLVLRGEHAPRSTRVIAETLPKLLPAARMAVIDGAGHMGPLTHADAVGACMAAHIGAVEAALRAKMPTTTGSRASRLWRSPPDGQGVAVTTRFPAIPHI